MFNVLLISDQPRLHTIVSSACDLQEGTFRIATSLNQGLQEIGRDLPDILFLQNRLSGLSGSILVRHVRSQLNAATRLVLFTDGGADTPRSETSGDIELDVSVSDTELSDAICEIIADQIAALGQAGAEEPPQTDAAAVAITYPPPVADADVDSVILSTARPVSGAGTGFMNDETRHAQEPEPIDDPLPRQATILSSSPPPIQWEKKRVKVAFAIIAAASILGSGAFLLVRQSAQPIPTAAPSSSKAAVRPTPPPPMAAPMGAPSAPLPSFIPVQARDAGYSAANPGWERYTSSAREYKIFREQGAMKALQVLDRRNAGIDPAFFTSVLQNLAKVSDYRLESRETKGEFLMKRGRLTPTSHVILYKSRSDKTLHAFVIYFDDAGTAPSDRKGLP